MRNTLASNNEQVLSITREGNQGVWGRFLTLTGEFLGPEFKITDEPAEVYCGWTMVAAAPNGSFAVTYVKWTGGADLNYRVMRIITTSGIGPAINVIPTFGEANFSERCGIVWTNDGWVIGIRLPGSPYPIPAIIRVGHNGIPQSHITLGPSTDYFNGPALARGGDYICALGYVKWGNTQGGTWMRVLDSITLNPLTPLLKLDEGAACEDHVVTFTGDHFLGHWSRPNEQVTSLIEIDGSFEPINIKPSAGSYCIAHNFDTCMTVIKDAASNLLVRYLSEDGIITSGDKKIADWDGITPDYHPSICATRGGWVINAQFGEGLRFFYVAEGQPIPPQDKLDDIIARLIRIEDLVKRERIIKEL